jgi:hypothetical protein
MSRLILTTVGGDLADAVSPGSRPERWLQVRSQALGCA